MKHQQNVASAIKAMGGRKAVDEDEAEVDADDVENTLKTPAKGSRNLNTGPGGWFGHQAAIFFITYLFMGVKRLKRFPDIVPSNYLVYCK